MLSAPVRWPFSFDLDDVEITGCILGPEPERRPDIGSGGVYSNDNGPQRAGDRVPGVWVTHKPTGKQAISTLMPTRDENIAVALRRLDRAVYLEIWRGRDATS